MTPSDPLSFHHSRPSRTARRSLRVVCRRQCGELGLDGSDGTFWRREEIEMLITIWMSRRTAGISECPPFSRAAGTARAAVRRAGRRSAARPRALSRWGARAPSSPNLPVISPPDSLSTLEFCRPEAHDSNSHTNDWGNFEFCTFSRVLHSSRSWEIGPLLGPVQCTGFERRGVPNCS